MRLTLVPHETGETGPTCLKRFLTPKIGGTKNYEFRLIHNDFTLMSLGIPYVLCPEKRRLRGSGWSHMSETVLERFLTTKNRGIPKIRSLA